eukprot:scaffold8.g1559.t1
MSSVTPLEHTAIGAFAGLVEICIMMPTVAIKNALQEGRPVPRAPRELYRGLLMNSGAMLPITASQFGMNRLLEQSLKRGLDIEELGSAGRIGVAMGAGSFSALFGAPAEFVVIQQQKSGRSLAAEARHIVAEHGLLKVYKGLVPTVARESLYAAGYLGVCPMLREALERQPAAFPDSTQYPQYRSTLSTVRHIVQTEGVGMLWAGLLPRSFRIVCAVFILNGTRNTRPLQHILAVRAPDVRACVATTDAKSAPAMETSSGNAWVDSYLNALLSFGLSSEYVKDTKEAGKASAEFDRELYSKYYVQSLLNLDEEALHNAWMKAASSGRQGGEKDARLMYLSWRIWHMKRKRARVWRERRAAAEAHEEGGSVITEPTSGGYSSDEEAEPKTPTEPFSRASTQPSPARAPVEARGKAEVTDVAPPEPPSAGATATSAAGAAAPAAEPTPKPPKKTLQVKTGAVMTAPDLPLGTVFEELVGSPRALAPLSGFENRYERLYVVLISLHGLVRAQHMELGRDADTGGQVKYVVELAKAISLHPAVYRVDLLTRLIRDPAVSPDYGREEECIRRGSGEHGGAYIVRLPCGPTHKYVRKELLWPYVREFADHGIAYATGMLAAMAEGGRRCELYVVHGHYADAGEAAVLMSSTLNVNMCMTGHSLGRNKLEHLLASGAMTKARAGRGRGCACRTRCPTGRHRHALAAASVATPEGCARSRLLPFGLVLRRVVQAEIEESYAISRRIEAEERGLDSSLIIFTSTQQARALGRRSGAEACVAEIDEQWGLYDGFSSQLSRVLKYRRSHGRHMPTLKVIPPGLDFSNLKVTMPEDPVLREFEEQRRMMEQADIVPPSPMAATSPRGSGQAAAAPSAGEEPASAGAGTPPSSAGAPSEASVPSTPTADKAAGSAVMLSPRSAPAEATLPVLDPLAGPPMWKEIARFLRNPLKPAILAMSRADPKKNVTTLVKAFGQHAMLRELANLVLIMASWSEGGNRDSIDSLSGGSQKVLTEVLKLVDAYDLYGSVAYPKHHTQNDISDIYLFSKATHGVFVNIALQEPFGLTVIEAAAHAVPTVATKNGGPVDIMATLHHGVIVDPTDTDAVAHALLGILTNPKTWDAMSQAGTSNIMAYSWPSHVKKYLDAIEAEKAFEKSNKARARAGPWGAHVSKHGRTLSGLLGRHAPPAVALGEEHGVEGPSPSAGAGQALPMQRYFSTPQALTTTAKDAELAGAGGIRKTTSGVSTDDLALLQSLGPEGMLRSGDEPRAASRRHLVAIPLDSDYCLPQFIAALRAVVEERERAELGEPVGVGVLSMLGFDSTRGHIEVGARLQPGACSAGPAAGLDMGALDFAVCNSGADIWHQLPDGHWDADESYEALVDFEWDRISLHRMLLKVVSQQDEGSSSRRLPRLKELLYNVQEAPTGGVHPRHICMELDEATQAILAAGMGPRRGAYAARGARLTVAVMERLRRRMRSKGLRATYTLQQVPRPGDGDFLSVLHITPVRASRPLAMRFLAHKFGLDLGAVSLVALVPALDAGRQLAATYTSDAADLLAGQQRVVVVPDEGGAAPEGGAPPARVLLESQGVYLEPYLSYGTRMSITDQASFAAEALAVAAGGSAGGGDGDSKAAA